MSLTRSRRVARRALAEIRNRDAWAHEVFSSVVGQTGLSDADVAFSTRLVYGTAATLGTLDEALDRHIDRPGRIHPLVRDALRLAAYELLFMRTPDRVAVHQGVESVREVGRSAAGLANAVLRRLAEEADTFPWGDPDTDIDALARQTGNPSWLAKMLVEDLGIEAAREMMIADLEPAPLYLAHNPFHTTLGELLDTLEREGAGPKECGPPGCIEVAHPAIAVRSATLSSGQCVVADAGAQYVASLAAPPPGGRGVDLAAGRGTKTLLMQAGSLRRGGIAEIVAADIHGFKTELLAERLDLLAVPGVSVVQADCTNESAVALLGGESSADVVLIDAPCSGLGTLRRHPEKRWRIRREDIEGVAAIGEAMLRVGARLVRPGGFMVYSTCTVTRRENADVVRGFVEGEAGEGFSVQPVSASAIPGWEAFVTAEGWFASHPTAGGPDGHFAAVLQRR